MSEDQNADVAPKVNTEIPQETLDSIFAPLYAALVARNYTDADLFDLIAQAIANQQLDIAHAFAAHARDVVAVLDEHNEDGTYPEIVAEVYRRTFFCLQGAARYGTGALIESGITNLQGFADYLIGSLAMDDAQAKATGLQAPFPVPGQAH